MLLTSCISSHAKRAGDQKSYTSFTCDSSNTLLERNKIILPRNIEDDIEEDGIIRMCVRDPLFTFKIAMNGNSSCTQKYCGFSNEAPTHI